MKERKGIFWSIERGEIPLPEAAKTLGMSVQKVNPDQGTISVNFLATEAFLNPAGTIQGGFLSAMLDDTIGPCILSILDEGQIAPTINLNINFIAAARPGKLTGTAKIISNNNSLITATGELYQNDQLIAAGHATALRRSLR